MKSKPPKSNQVNREEFFTGLSVHFCKGCKCIFYLFLLSVQFLRKHVHSMYIENNLAVKMRMKRRDKIFDLWTFTVKRLQLIRNLEWLWNELWFDNFTLLFIMLSVRISVNNKKTKANESKRRENFCPWFLVAQTFPSLKLTKLQRNSKYLKSEYISNI